MALEAGERGRGAREGHARSVETGDIADRREDLAAVDSGDDAGHLGRGALTTVCLPVELGTPRAALTPSGQ